MSLSITSIVTLVFICFLVAGLWGEESLSVEYFLMSPLTPLAECWAMTPIHGWMGFLGQPSGRVHSGGQSPIQYQYQNISIFSRTISKIPNQGDLEAFIHFLGELGKAILQFGCQILVFMRSSNVMPLSHTSVTKCHLGSRQDWYHYVLTHESVQPIFQWSN